MEADKSFLSLQQAAQELEIEPWRMYRLGRYLRIDVDDKCVPRSEIERAHREKPEDRYIVVLHWLLREFCARPEKRLSEG